MTTPAMTRWIYLHYTLYTHHNCEVHHLQTYPQPSSLLLPISIILPASSARSTSRLCLLYYSYLGRGWLKWIFSMGQTAMDQTFFKKSMFFLHFVGDVNAFSRVHSRRRSRFFRGNTDFTQAVDSWQLIFNGSYGNGSNIFLKSMFFLHFVGDVNAISRVHSRRRSHFF